MQIQIIGAGLAGSEAAYQIIKLGICVKIYEMRPKQSSKAHKTADCAELVCSNSFRGKALTNAVGLLKEELRALDSLIMHSADLAEVPAGGALAVDRVRFSKFIDNFLRTHPLVEFVTEEIQTIPHCSNEEPVIIATGPLTSSALAFEIEKLSGQNNLAFFDAISPIILGSSIDLNKIFRQSRYDKGGDDYLNIPLSAEQYYQFVDEIKRAEKFGAHAEVEGDDIANLRPFEGCMPIEEMVERGMDTLRFGPMKPVGLRDPKTGLRPYAVIQLRQDDQAGNLWSMVGFQTRLKHPEQLRIFKMLPGLENCEFVRLGSVHRNTFINSPNCLKPTLEYRSKPGLFFAGQITGVEGYVESTAAGLVAGVNAVRLAQGKETLSVPANTAIGALLDYISDANRSAFQPMNISFGLIADYNRVVSKKNKTDKRLEIANQALKTIEAWRSQAISNQELSSSANSLLQSLAKVAN